MDSIQLTGIKAYGYTGALPEEAVLGQWFEVDIFLYLDLSKGCKSDDLADTYDYRGIIETTQSLIKEQNFQLVERLADEIMSSAFKFDPRLDHVTVKVKKLNPPIPDFFGQTAVEITRTAPNSAAL